MRSWIPAMATVVGAVALAALVRAPLLADVSAAARTLDLYFIDVEGGQSTLIVTPAGQSMLVDTGYAGFNGRDPGRILAAARDAGVSVIDYLLLTHYHQDHAGGFAEVARQIPIRAFIDHDDLERTPGALAGPRWSVNAALHDAWAAARAKGRHLEPKPGDRLPLKGLEVTVISSAAATLAKPLPGGGQPNPACGGSAPPPEDPFENPRSTGFLLRFGAFSFLDLGDLTGAPLLALLCPNSAIGPVDLALVPHHGAADASYPAVFFAWRPRVAIVNNGAIKGGSAEVFANLRGAPGLEDAWQLHTSKITGAVNLADRQIANLDETTGHWVKVSASNDGAFSVTNGRTGVTKRFMPRLKR